MTYHFRPLRSFTGSSEFIEFESVPDGYGEVVGGVRLDVSDRGVPPHSLFAPRSEFSRHVSTATVPLDPPQTLRGCVVRRLGVYPDRRRAWRGNRWVASVAEPTASGPLVRGWGRAVRFSGPAVSVADATHILSGSQSRGGSFFPFVAAATPRHFFRIG